MAVSSIPPSPSRRWRRHHRPRVSLLRQQAIVVCSPPAGTLSHAHALNEHGHAAHKQQRPADCHADQKTRLRFEPLRDAFVKRYPIARPAPPPARCFRPGFADADALQAVRAREERRYCCCRACCNRCGHACVVTSVSGHATRRTYGVSVVGQMVVYTYDEHSYFRRSLIKVMLILVISDTDHYISPLLAERLCTRTRITCKCTTIYAHTYS